MNKKIIGIGIVSMFLLTGITAVSAFDLEETEAKSNQSLILQLTDYDPVVNLNDVVSFEISVSDPNGEPALFHNYKVYTRPYVEDISCQRVGDKIVGEFTATRTGMYSLIVDVADVNNCVEKDIFYYFVGSFEEAKIRYYFRDDLPTHGQPRGPPAGFGSDCGSLLFTPPTVEENRNCGYWVQFSPDELPENPISILTNINIYCWYRFIGDDHGDQKYIGIQKFATYWTRVNKYKPVPYVDVYTWINKDFSIFWPMVRARSWYWLSLKLVGGALPPSLPYLMTKPEQPSYADFTYIYCKIPDIKSISNADVTVLSATTQAGNSNNAEIILEGTGTTNLVIQMPDNSKMYSAKLNGVDCDFTQRNGEVTFTLYLDSEHTEHSLHIYPSQSRLLVSNFKVNQVAKQQINQQLSGTLLYQTLQQLQKNYPISLLASR